MKAAGQTVRPVKGLKKETDFVVNAYQCIPHNRHMRSYYRGIIEVFGCGVVAFAMGDKCCDKESLPRELLCFKNL
jgi:hypothetical protein